MPFGRIRAAGSDLLGLELFDALEDSLRSGSNRPAADASMEGLGQRPRIRAQEGRPPREGREGHGRYILNKMLGEEEGPPPGVGRTAPPRRQPPVEVERRGLPQGRFEDTRLLAFPDDDESIPAPGHHRRLREFRDALVEFEAADVEVIISRGAQPPGGIRIGGEIRDVDDGTAKVRLDHSTQERARRDRHVEGVEGLQPVRKVPPELRRFPGQGQASETRGLLAQSLIELEQVVPGATDPIVVGRIHLQAGGGNVDQVEAQQGEIVKMDDVGPYLADESRVMSPNDWGSAEDPRTEGLEPARGCGDRVSNHAAGPLSVGRWLSPLERQGRRRIFHVDLVALRRERLGQIADVVGVAPQVIGRIERRRHEEPQGLRLTVPPAGPGQRVNRHGPSTDEGTDLEALDSFVARVTGSEEGPGGAPACAQGAPKSTYRLWASRT